MSKDLLAELDAFYTPHSTLRSPDQHGIESDVKDNDVQQINANTTFQLGTTSLIGISEAVHEDNESSVDFGNFEDAGPRSTSSAITGLVDQETPRQSEAPLKGRKESSTTHNLQVFDLQALPVYTQDVSTAATPGFRLQPQENKTRRDPDVLFDADEEQSDDDTEFGAFEMGNLEPGVFEPATVTEANFKWSQSSISANVNHISDSLVDLETSEIASTDSPSSINEVPWQTHSKASSFRKANRNESRRLSTEPQRPATFYLDQDNPWASLDEQPSNTIRQTAKLQKKAPLQRLPSNDPDDFSAWIGLDSTQPSKPGISSLGHAQRAVSEQEAWQADDAWDELDDGTTPPAALTGQQQPAQKSSIVLPSELSGMPLYMSVMPSPSQLPPSNVPPPSVLLALFPSLISTGYETFFKPFSSLSATNKDIALTHPNVHAFLKMHLAFITVAARIIAGRKHRWKRDSRLAQGVRIGAAGGKGMKLAGVDKAELGREQRDVAEVVRLWKEQIGKVRVVVTRANAEIANRQGSAEHVGAVPELKETMTVRELKQSEGGVPSKRSCALCGLNRNERVVGLEDSSLVDAFGEWWTDSLVMHKDCSNFWDNQEPALRGR